MALLMVCVCVWLCCGWVVAEVVGSSGFSMGFFYFFIFFIFFIFFLIIWVFVSVRFW